MFPEEMDWGFQGTNKNSSEGKWVFFRRKRNPGSLIYYSITWSSLESLVPQLIIGKS